MKAKTLFVFFFTVIAFSVNAQTDDYSTYLDKAREKIEAGDCEGAQKFYNVYKELSGKTLRYFEKEIESCFNDKNTKDNYLKKERNEYFTAPFVTYGAGYPWNIVTSIEFRHGGLSGFGLYGDLGMNFTNINYTYTNDNYTYIGGQGHTTKTSFRYVVGVKYYIYKGFSLDLGYGALAPASATVDYPLTWHTDIEERVREYVETGHGLLFHLGYDFYEGGDKGWFIGVSIGASYNVVDTEVSPLIMLKIGGAFGY